MHIRAELLTLLAMAVAIPAALAQSTAPGGATGGSSLPAAAAVDNVLELFTSQGCSSCPAADAVLRTYAQRPATIALSLSVDYWDHLGWKDTLASPKHSARQKAYVKTLGTGNVYTPQMIVNGAAETVGSNKAEIEKAIARSAKVLTSARPRLSAASDGKRVTIDIGEADAGARSGTVWLAVVAPRVDVEVKRGENRGRTLSYHNVVREISPVGMWSGKPMRIELPLSALMEAGHRCAVLLQGDDGGRILAATWMAP